MSRESGQDRSQKTVAELLALHGGNVDGGRAVGDRRVRPSPARAACAAACSGFGFLLPDRARGAAGIGCLRLADTRAGLQWIPASERDPAPGIREFLPAEWRAGPGAGW